jgi:hypothetical protein
MTLQLKAIYSQQATTLSRHRVNHLIRPSGLTISGAAKDGERVCFVAPRSLPIARYFLMRAPSHRDHRLHPLLSRTSISAYLSFLRKGLKFRPVCKPWTHHMWPFVNDDMLCMCSACAS